MTRMALLPLLLLSACTAPEEAPQANGDAAQQAEAPQQQAGQQPSAQPVEPAATKPVAQAASPCLVQDGSPVPANSIRAIGTEPFWGASVEGRCVTYSHPDDQAGTRVWTKFSGTAENGTWTGALGGQPFVMKTTPQPGCSDGMSDRRYPIAVSLTVGGEQRSGCAAPR